MAKSFHFNTSSPAALKSLLQLKTVAPVMEDNTESRKFVWVQLSIQPRAKELKNGSLAAKKITQACPN